MPRRCPLHPPPPDTHTQVVMMGFSMGGYVTAAFAAAHPDMVCGVLLAACAHDTHTLTWKLVGKTAEAVYRLCSYKTKSQVRACGGASGRKTARASEARSSSAASTQGGLTRALPHTPHAPRASHAVHLQGRAGRHGPAAARGAGGVPARRGRDGRVARHLAGELRAWWGAACAAGGPASAAR